MSVEVYVKTHIEFDFRDEQKPEDVFELYTPGRDAWWLNEAELREFRDALDAALEAHTAGTSAARGRPVDDKADLRGAS